MASAYHQGATLPGPPAGGARSRTRRARRATGGRSATASAGGSRVAAGSVREEGGVLCRAARRGMRGRLGRRANRRARRPRVAQRRRRCRDTSRGRRASADTRGGRARRARRARARPLGEDLRGVRARRGRCQSERRGAARRRRACRGFRWRETVVRSTPAVVRRRRAPSGSPSCSGSCSSNTPRSCTIDVGKLGASGAPDDVIIATGRAGGCCATTPRALLSRW